MRRAQVPLEVTVDRGSPIGIPEQLVRAVREAVATGVLRPGDPMVSSRALAEHLGLSRGTVVAAYDQLTAEGYLQTRPRSGAVIHAGIATQPTTPHTRPTPTRPVAPAPTPPALDFVPGHENAAPLDDAAWRRAWREAATPPGRAHWRPDPQGEPELRAAIADHLRLMRGMTVPADSIVVTSGARDGLSLVLDTIGQPLDRPVRVGVESPGFPGLRRSLERNGVRAFELGSDDEGPVTSRRSAQPLDLALLTPNHQFPYGTAIPAQRRRELLTWAADQGCLIVEDDYDSEFRHLGPALPALSSLDPHRVVHLGTFVAVLGRDLGSGYVIAPPTLVDRLVQTRRALGVPVAPILQRALAGYLADGGLRRRIARSRRRLSAAGRVVRQSLAGVPGLSGATDTGHLIVIECSPRTARRVRTDCLRHGVAVGDLADGWAGDADRHGIVLSYGAHSPDDVARGLAVLAAALQSAG